MKHSIQTLLFSLFFTAVIGGTEWLFWQGTFFSRSVNLITQICLLLLLIAVWYWFISDLLQHRNFSATSVPSDLTQTAPSTAAFCEPEEQLIPADTHLSEPDPEPVAEPIAVHGTEETVFMPENAEGAQWIKAAESTEKPVESTQEQEALPFTDKNEEQPDDPIPQQAPPFPSAHNMTSAEKAKLKAQMQQEKAEEKARKLQEAAAEKQAQRARKLEEETARQKQKLEDLKAEAARKKAAAPAKRTYWNTRGE